MPSVHAIQPSPFDPQLGLDKLESYSDGDDDDVEEAAAPANKGKRKQPSKVEDYFTKQVKAAKSIILLRTICIIYYVPICKIIR